MNKIWLHTVKSYLKLGLFFYFKKIKVTNASVVPIDKPVMILCNHQNALLDALLIATKSKRFIHFLTRAGVFKKPFVARLLKSLQMLPVYRIRDGWNNLSKNNPVFSNCTELLNKNEGIVLFPEGSHNLVRTVRPLSKGFTRIIFETLQKYPDTELQLIPVGLNYVHATKYEDSVAMNFGEPISANELITDFTNSDVIQLKSAVHSSISQLTTHIPTDSYDEVIKKLDKLNADFLDHESINNCIENDFKDCKKWPIKRSNFIKAFLKWIFTILIFGPYLLWKYYVKPKIVEIEFMSTFRFAVGVTVVPLWIIVISAILWMLIGWQIALIYAASVIILELLILKF